MTVNLPTDPGAHPTSGDTYASARYTVTVNAASAFVTGETAAMTVGKLNEWNAGEEVEVSHVNFETDEEVEVVIEMTTGSIDSFKVFPEELGIPAVLADGALTLTMDPGQKAWVAVNGDYMRLLQVFADELLTLPSATVTYNGSQTQVAAGARMTFPSPGVYVLGQEFPIGAGSTLIVPRGVRLIGTFKIAGANATIIGLGTLSGEHVTYDEFNSLFEFGEGTFEERIPYAIIHHGAAASKFANCTVRGVVVTRPAWYCQREGTGHILDTKFIAPWHPENGLVSPFGTSSDDVGELKRCSIWTNDDAIDGSEYHAPVVGDNNLVGTVFMQNINCGYWPADAQGTTTFTRTYALAPQQFVTFTNPDFPDVSVDLGVVVWATTDGVAGEDEGEVVDSVTIDGLYVENWDRAINARPFHFGNLGYPWARTAINPAGDQIGELENWQLRNVSFASAPTVRSVMVGKDATNTPHDMSFIDVYYGDKLLTAANWATYFDQNAFPYNIVVGTGSGGGGGGGGGGGSGSGSGGTGTGGGGTVAGASLVVEDGTGVAEANSYCTVAFANAYHAAYGNPSAWSGATKTTKEDALRVATRVVDEAYGARWHGSRVDIDQALDWPRESVVDTNGTAYLADDEIPVALKRWVARYALLHINGEDLSPETQANGDVRSESLSAEGFSKSVTYSGVKTATKRFPALERMLRNAGLISSASGWGVVES